ncbi:MAG: hypothetical protein H8E64_02830 [Candidatus Marinimicrobia bacterium]|nr:hypothetical protein [Candidatus Neomarinimicrobiota bacterium]
MQHKKINIIQQLLIGYFCFSLALFNSVKSPVLCLEADGHINIESNCDSECDIPKEDNHQDDCGECVDVQLWDTKSDTNFLLSSTDFDFEFNLILSESFLLDVFHQISFVSHSKENPNTHFPPLLKHTILLI